ncbi:MAG: phosphate ABC transporter substrate-binding protein PstS [Actinobacteria bacterium]|nr:phosphate ABC transporter substrate-binding protein PstS [Actinomycetota bacterium]MBV8563105.1 phosphate ABC transporter substrate-binding protein PstS [Actinomycetota bacterium]
MLKRLILAGAALAAAVAAIGAGGAAARSHDSSLQGAGSSLIAPALAVWQPLYGSARGVTVNYSAIGSGGGIAAITARTVDFGASDAPLTPDQATACNNCVQIPWALTATVPVYNIPGVPDTKLKLSSTVLADIFLGKITSWDDPAIKKLNPGLNLPSTKITTVHRSDGSGDTYAFTDYLAHVSPQWRSQVGTATSVNWPNGVGGAKNAGVAALVQSTPGSIGYVSDAYVLQNHLNKVRLQNRSGRFALPSIQSIEEAAQAVKSVPADNNLSIVNPPAGGKYSDAWPISTFTYVIVPLQTSKAKDIKNFVSWALTHGQQPIKKLVFAPMPLVVIRAANKTLAKIHS